MSRRFSVDGGGVGGMDMGLRETSQAAANSAVVALGNVAVSTTYQAFVSTTYNASAGTNVVTRTTTGSVSVIFHAFRLEQIDGVKVKPEDKIALIAQKQIPGVTPGVNDRVTEGATVWEVQRANVDPAGAMWELQVRKP